VWKSVERSKGGKWMLVMVFVVGDGAGTEKGKAQWWEVSEEKRENS